MSDDAPEHKPSFWVTAPGLITGIGGLLTAIAVLIGALNAAGLIGSEDDAPATPTTTASPTASPYPDAVLNGQWAVLVTIGDVDGDPGDNTIWGFEDPEDGVSRSDTWFMESECVDQPCTTSWRSPPPTMKRFSELTFDGDRYSAFSDMGMAKCATGPVTVTRKMDLTVTAERELDGVSRATAIQGRIEISWTCDSEEISGIVTARGERVDI